MRFEKIYSKKFALGLCRFFPKPSLLNKKPALRAITWSFQFPNTKINCLLKNLDVFVVDSREVRTTSTGSLMSWGLLMRAKSLKQRCTALCINYFFSDNMQRWQNDSHVGSAYVFINNWQTISCSFFYFSKTKLKFHLCMQEMRKMIISERKKQLQRQRFYVLMTAAQLFTITGSLSILYWAFCYLSLS